MVFLTIYNLRTKRSSKRLHYREVNSLIIKNNLLTIEFKLKLFNIMRL